MPADKTPVAHTPEARAAHMRLLVDQLKQLEIRLRAGGGPAKIEKQHKAGKLTAGSASRNSSIQARASSKSVTDRLRQVRRQAPAAV